MMKSLYRFFNARWIDRLILQHKFESIASSPENLRKVRAAFARAAVSAPGESNG